MDCRKVKVKQMKSFRPDLLMKITHKYIGARASKAVVLPALRSGYSARLAKPFARLDSVALLNTMGDASCIVRRNALNMGIIALCV